MRTIAIRQADMDDLDQLALLFDAYRQFYEKPSDLALARNFLAERINRHESVIFIALNTQGTGVGFTQLYPSFSSTRAARIYILNDLFVTPAARRQGVAAGLLDSAAQFARTTGAIRLGLSTALNNLPAQQLYESRGWKRDQVFCEYSLML